MNQIKTKIYDALALMDKKDRAPKREIRPLLNKACIESDNLIEKLTDYERRMNRVFLLIAKYRSQSDYDIESLLTDLESELKIYLEGA